MSDKFNYVKRGYDPTEVDTYIETLENVITSYKEKDAAIKNALINAQIAADNIIKNAEIEVANLKLRAVAQLDKIEYSVAHQRTLVDNLKRDYYKIVSDYIKTVEERDFQPIYDQISKLEDYINSLKKTPELPEDEVKTPPPAASAFVTATPAPEPKQSFADTPASALFTPFSQK